MFDRFDTHGRGLVVLAQSIGVSEGAGALGTEHLVAALLLDGVAAPEPSTATRVLWGFGVSLSAAKLIAQTLRGHRPVRPLSIEEATALRQDGVDLDGLVALPPSVEEARQEPAPERPPGNLGMSSGAKKSMEGALREAILLNDQHLGSEHLLLGLLRYAEPAGTAVLHLCGVDLEHARASVAAMPRQPVDRAPMT